MAFKETRSKVQWHCLCHIEQPAFPSLQKEKAGSALICMALAING